MMSFFLNPWVMAAGAALAAAPIIIHLINRIRFRRVEWAAMEFLLKAQKKMRRKKVLEQLLLLLLRILLVLLAGLLLARFLGSDPSKGKETRPVVHLIVMDDSPSMLDNGGDAAGGVRDAFDRAKVQITDKIMPAAAKASTPQSLRIIRLSDQVDILNEDAGKALEVIDTKLTERVKGLLATEKATTVHASVVPGLKKAKEMLEQAGGDVAKVVHLISDMRSVDWYRDADSITQAVNELTEAGAKVHLIDVSAPNRKADRKTPSYSDNVGIVEFKPRNRVVAADKEVEFELRVRNYGNTDLKNVLAEFYLNGLPNVITSKGFEILPAKQERTEIVIVTFSTAQGATIATREDPLARFNLLTAQLKNTGPDAIVADNVRHAAVEVRDKLSVLVVMNPTEFEQSTKPEGPKKDGDSFYLRNLFEIKFSGLDWVSGTPDALVKQDLREFSSIYLLNVPQLTEQQVANLERYAQEGGGVGFFMGPDAVPEKYNELLYRKGEGFFPFPLPSTPTEPLTDEAKFKRSLSLTKRVLLRDPAARSHPALQGIYSNERGGAARDNEVERFFLFAGIDQHWKIERIGRWREDRSIQELYCLPNEQPTSEFEARVVKLIDAVKSKYGEPKFEKYRTLIDGILGQIRSLAGDPENPPLTELARQMDRLLSDEISEGNPDEALLREFWGQPEMAEARALAQSLRDSTKYGDPLYVARRFGNGRVAVFTIPVGAPWTDWPSGPGSAGWVAVMTELQKYLAGGGAEENRVVGSAFQANFEVGRYKPEATWSFLTYDPTSAEQGAQRLTAVRDPVAGQPPRTIPLDLKDGSLQLNFADTKRAGAYFFNLTWNKRDGDPVNAPPTKPEFIAAVFNYDTELEGDLKRANTDDLKNVAKGTEDVHSPEDDSWLTVLEQRPSDLSSGRWLYLLILLVLIFEQAMAVRLSYHNRPDELEAFAPSAAAAMAGRTTVQSEAEASPAAGPAA